MNLLNKLTIKNLKLNKKRTIVTIIGIILSVALITAVSSIYSSGMKSITDYEKMVKGNFHVVFYNVPSKEINSFKNNRQIETINITEGLGYSKIDSKNEYKPYAYIAGFTETSLKNLAINLKEGRLPQNDSEIVIPTHLKTNGRVNFKIGDNITLEIGRRVNQDGKELTQRDSYFEDEEEEKIVDTTSKTYKIVGIIERPASNVEDYSAPGYTFITKINEENISKKADLFIRFTKDGEKNAYALTGNILGIDSNLLKKAESTMASLTEEESENFFKQSDNAKYQYNMNSYLISLETDPLGLKTSPGGLIIVVLIVILIIIFTSVFCIKNSFDISITEKIKQYGILRSVGATKKQIKKNVFFEGTILGLIGIPLGILVGVFASYILIIVSNYYMKDSFPEQFNLKLIVSPIAILVAILLGIITIYLSASRSAKKASKVSPIVSIRNSNDIKIKAKKLKTPKIINKLFGVGGVISYKNLKRNKKKYRTTVISIIVSVITFIALSEFTALGFKSISGEIDASEYNISLSAADVNNEEYKTILETTKSSEVQNFTVLRYDYFDITNLKYTQEYEKEHYFEYLDSEGDAEIPDENITSLKVIALGKDQYEKYVKSLGLKYDDVKNKGVLYNTETLETYNPENDIEIKKYDVYDAKEKDVLKGESETKDKNNAKDINIPIAKITKEIPFGLKNSYMDAFLVVSDEYFDSKFENADDISVYYDSKDADKLQDEIENELKAINYDSYRLNNISENVRQMNNLLILVSIFLYGFIIVISLIAITNIINVITTNMELRKPEFASLKSIGMTNKEFNRMIKLESLFMGIKSLFYGIVFGTLISYIIFHYFTEAEPELEKSFSIPIKPIIISIIVVFALIFVIMNFSIRKINKQNIVETIRNENI